MTETAQQTDQTVLLVETDGRLRILTLNRPDRMNALTPELHHALRDALAEAASDSNIGAVVLTGAGRAFCSGGDVMRSAQGAAEQAKVPETVEQRADTLRQHGGSTLLLNRMPKPTIALINGAAVGAGLTLALACDLRFIARGATLRSGYGRIALSGDLGVSYFLTRLVGPAHARSLMFLDEKVDAEKGQRIGLINEIFEPDELHAEGLKIARSLANGPSVALRYMKQSLGFAENATLEQVIEREAYNSARCVRTQDVKEAATAFREKRAPQFIGR
jgi:2-(1,2-epoxy-1,2-dihydrophenyl)acetyl-CoA isomerase